MKPQTIDITPTPRVLSILGDIPFETWQCIAELLDNSLDAFASANRRGVVIENPEVSVTWSRENVPAGEREIVFLDNGTGMDLSTLQNAARAGFSSNDPIHNLGLFGMGFNIATAKLGEETEFLSTQAGDAEWVGIRINFSDLQSAGTFQAPVIVRGKDDPSVSGTMIVVRHFKDGVWAELSRKATMIRKRLEKVYTPILSKKMVSIVVQGKDLNPRPLCVWGESRFVVRRGKKIFAIQKIDTDLGSMFFDESRNRYISEEEFDGLTDEEKNKVVRRSRRLTGWIGIQRFCDPSDFGIDFVRNGRKILVGDKSLFQFENPETGTPVIEYPIELGTTTGGRIVGELNVDYLIPTYQKNGFNTTDSSWALTRAAVRGAGPFLPKNRELLAYSGSNESPLGVLVNGYRRLDKGTKNLSVDNAVAKDFYREFQRGNPEFSSDEKWFKAAQEHDSEEGTPTTPVNPGDLPSDNLDDYIPSQTQPPTNATATNLPGAAQTNTTAIAVNSSTTRNELIQHSERLEILSKKYTYDNRQGSFNVNAYQVKNLQIKENGSRKPCVLFQDGVDLDFFFDPTHPLLSEYPITTKQIMLMELAERFAARDGGVSAINAYFDLVSLYMEDERINADLLRNRASSILQTIRDAMPALLKGDEERAKSVLKEDPSEEEQCLNKLLSSAPSLIEHYQSGDSESYRAFAFVPDSAIARLVKAMPENFLDGRIFSQPYASIDFENAHMTMRLRNASVSIVTAYIGDAAALLSGGTLNKLELIRYGKSLDLLEALTK